ncbi:response regulator [Oscillatoria sp. CS-180]|uniref:hybrid sensor histidine kinase/response regulator n=1 Tax=Oscillatoria sp. CS-180 TaxID=3021720 RepID=UPI00232EA4C6|nr:response regulator [Oscillatoria sp. CS-180]MDB9526335.1 response regulator [Oscillatoria sp. CS-180]
MADDKELQIRLQFLDEAQEYLNTLESRLIGLAQGVDGETINDALRAAHSIKGGAALMGFEMLSDLAHRLEDNLKVLKVQRQQVSFDAALESQLLIAVDCMGQIVGHSRQHFEQGHSIPLAPDNHWLQEHVLPVFEQLRERLGEPEEEDAYSMLAPEEDHDIIPLLFQSEVEGCLQRLEGVLAESSPCLREETQILAQELAGLGEMLQLESFTQLCQAIGAQVIAIADDQLSATVQAALETWRSAQALVIAGNIAAVPSQFTGSADNPLAPLSEEEVAQTFAEAWEQNGDDTVLAIDSSQVSEETLPLTEVGLVPSEFFQEDFADVTVNGNDSDYFEAQSSDAFLPDSTEPSPAEVPFDETPPTASQTVNDTEAAPQTDSTVRVPVKQINQLSDMFGELIIERNRLEVEVRRLRGLVTTMQTRMRTLETVNSDLRNVYDRVATQSQTQLATSTAAVASPELTMSDNSTQAFDVLELDRYGEAHLPFREIIETIVQLQEVGDDIDLSLNNTEQTARGLRKTSRQLQKYLTQLRMRPLADIFDRFPRALRQMSLQYDKPVTLKLKGENTLVDRNVLEALQDPLMHIFRNCFDHGIEDVETRQQHGKPTTGTISISAKQRSGRTIITIRDDGGGIALEKIRDRAIKMGLDEALLAAASKQDLLSLIFEPGFSTASEVTNLSGRGVGMDVVRSKLKEIRGDIQVDTEAGVGTVFTLSIPFTLSVTRVLIVESRGMRMAFPVDAVEEMFSLEPEQILSTVGKDSFEWNGELLQLVKLSDWLHFNCPVSLESPEIAPAISTPTVLLVQYNQRLVGIQIDRSWGEQEVALRRVIGNLPMPTGFNSCTILGDGQVVPLVAVPELLYWIASCEASGTKPSVDDSLSTYLPAGADSDTGSPLLRKPTVLLVDDSINVRRFIALTLEKAGYQVAQAKDGQDALDKLKSGLAVEAILCDVEMPRLDGYGFLSRVKSNVEHQQIPVAMLTSRGSPKHRQMAMNLGAAAYFTKPYNEQTLLKTLESLIEPALV